MALCGASGRSREAFFAPFGPFWLHFGLAGGAWGDLGRRFGTRGGDFGTLFTTWPSLFLLQTLVCFLIFQQKSCQKRRTKRSSLLLGPRGSTLGSRVELGAISGAVLGPVGVILAPLWLHSGILGGSWGDFGPIWAPFGAHLATLWPLLAPSGPLLAAFWHHFGHFWLHLDHFWTPFGLTLATFGSIWATFGDLLGQKTKDKHKENKKRQKGSPKTPSKRQRPLSLGVKK